MPAAVLSFPAGPAAAFASSVASMLRCAASMSAEHGPAWLARHLMQTFATHS
jgi:hypothetical protein